MKKRILVAPLNWGLGHATRCIPIINALINFGFEPIIASDGDALALLQKEFPDLFSIELPSYKISYSKKKAYFKLKLLKDTPKILKAIKAEKKATKHIVETHGIVGIISDNRLGVNSKKAPSVIVTHQLNVLSGSSTWLSTLLHKEFIKHFDACWVPDFEVENNLSGKLVHSNSIEVPITYIGPLSRFLKKDTKPVNKLLVILSGPEPQRTLLGEKLLSELKNHTEKTVFIKGNIENEQSIQVVGNMTLYNFMTTEQLEKTINESELIISRSGYTTIMDLAKLGKKAFFIPTPGQYEQEYLAKRLCELNIVPYCNQNDFTLEKLEHLEHFKGFEGFSFETDYKDLFSLFERE
ncbi:glycosyltransferase [Confluentibacter flavum]|uniref:Glycosyltransferase n=1 Tax=Confluentibacter flavum TaxID=1909700 RepID=A0A2N3HPX5_9FLAO|nr:glycosyltransferase [Confluentibacter flavum]PKQ46914.1 glycosyltransferase [Confluentibacter flavum]